MKCKSCESKKTAVKINNVAFCTECLRHIERLAQINGRERWEELTRQVEYLTQGRQRVL